MMSVCFVDINKSFFKSSCDEKMLRISAIVGKIDRVVNIWDAKEPLAHLNIIFVP